MSTRNIADFVNFPTHHGHHRSSLPPDNTLVLITLTLATPAEFLLHHFIHTALTSTTPTTSRRSVVFVSFTNNYIHHASGLRKWGLDLTAHKQAGKFTFIDGFSDILLPAPAPSNTVSNPGPGGADPRLYFPAAGLNSLAPPITTALKGKEEPVLIIEGLETLCTLGLGDANEVLDLLTFLQKFSSTTLLTLPTDPPLLRPLLPPPTATATATATTTTPLEHAHTLLLTSLATRAFRIINVEPLSTGRAKDVTGVLRMVRGGGCYVGGDGGDGSGSEGKEQEEGRGEWLFSGIRVFARGHGV
ncbi:hypothetical protein YB2330_002395 [Saitoella coloradoensis]